jgi:hypothetical protein
MIAKEQTFRHLHDEVIEPTIELFPVHPPSTEPKEDHTVQSTLSKIDEKSIDEGMRSRLISVKFFVITVSFVMGLYDLCSLPSFMYQKETLKLSPQQIQMITGLIYLPWSIKPLFGYLFDNLILVVKKTKYIIMVCACVRIALYSYFVSFSPGVYGFYFCSFFIGMCSLFENIISEYTLVLSTKRENELNPGKASNHLPIFFGFRAFGSLIGNFFGGRVIKSYGIPTAFMICSKLPIIVIIVACIYNERNVSTSNTRRTWREQIDIMGQLIFRDRVLQLIVFICLINMAPNFDAMYTFYMTDHLKFTTEDLANFSTMATICYVLGLLLYSLWLKNINPRKFYLGTNFTLWLINISFLLVVLQIIDQWGFNNKIFCLLNQGMSSMVSEMNFMPILAIWCGICPKNLEATSITLFTGLINFSSNLSNYFGAFLIWAMGYRQGNFEKIWRLIVIQNSYLFLALVGISCVDFPDPRHEKNDEDSPQDLHDNEIIE